MSQSYLEKYRSKIPTAQGSQILKILTAKRDSGEIKNIDEFKAKLQSLTQKILEERITPTLVLFNAIAGIDTSYEQYNEMLDRIQDDLKTAFQEADNLDEIILSHNNIINSVSLKALRYGINELEAKISMYEFLNKNSYGFDDSLFNTFSESLNQTTSRSSMVASIVYKDFRKQEEVPISQDCEVDVVGERLILGSESKKYLQVKDVVWLSNINSIRSELDVSFKSSSISNIIDGKNHTYWIEPILRKEIDTAGVPMEILFHLNASQDINFVEIEPASMYPMVLVGIDYYDSNGTRKTALDTDEQLVRPTRINFNRITTNKLILRIKQENYKETQFKQKIGESNFERTLAGELNNSIDIESVSEDLKAILTSDFILNTIFKVKNQTLEQVKYYEYLLGFDNIRIGFSVFNDRGIYVSKAKKINKLGQVALKVKEYRPTQAQDSTSITLEEHTYSARSNTEDAYFYHGIIEYYIVAQSYTVDDYLIKTDIIPILPIEASRVYHERIVFTAQSPTSLVNNICQLRFYTDAVSSDVLVYRNGLPLTYGSSNDWEFLDYDDSDNPNETVIIAGSGSPMKQAIKVNQTINSLDIYTVSYTPKVSNTLVKVSNDSQLIKVTDMVGDNGIRITQGNVLVFEDIRSSLQVEYTNIYFVILMHRNSAIQNFSPVIDEYTVVTGSKNQNKF